MIHHLQNKKVSILTKSAGRIDRVLRDSFGAGSEWLTSKTLDTLFEQKRIRYPSGKTCKAGDQCSLGESISIEFPESSLGVLPSNLDGEQLRSCLIYLDPHKQFLLWNKKAGIPSVPQLPWEKNTAVNEIYSFLLSEKMETLATALFDAPSFDLGLTQRLDGDTSGIVLFALTKESKALFRESFSSHKFEKSYLAIVCGSYAGKEGLHEFYLSTKNSKKTQAFLQKKAAELQKVSLNIKCLQSTPKLSLMQVTTCYGARHVVRVCMSVLGYPLLGDQLYGAAENDRMNYRGAAHFLHATSLRLTEKTSPFSSLVVGYSVGMPSAFMNCLKEYDISAGI